MVCTARHLINTPPPRGPTPTETKTMTNGNASPRSLAAIHALLDAEVSIVEARRDDYMVRGFGRSGSSPGQIAALVSAQGALRDVREALDALDRAVAEVRQLRQLQATWPSIRWTATEGA